MATIAEKLSTVRQRMDAACIEARRDVASVTLLGASKQQGPEAIREAMRAGLHRFGENYVQEALDKMAALAAVRTQLEWHLIGPLQSNKTRAVAEAFDWVQTVDRLKIAERLAAQRPAALAPLQVCVQVNVSAEASKGGVAPAELLPLARAVAALPRLALRGLMAIPEPSAEPAAQRAAHRRLRQLFDDLRREGLELDTLSMGMSADLEAAVAEGSTIVRVGSALFGERARAFAS